MLETKTEGLILDVGPFFHTLRNPTGDDLNEGAEKVVQT